MRMAVVVPHGGELIPTLYPDRDVAASLRSLAMLKAQIAASGAQGMRDIGKVMGPVMQAMRGRADGRLVQETARRLLGG